MISTESSKQWFAVYTRPRWEKKVSELLSKNGIENYCPLSKVSRQWSDRRKIVYEPLFTSYVFVRISSADQFVVRSTVGVLNFVYWLGRPALIRNEEIDLIKRFLNEHENVKLQRTEIRVNEQVRIIGGPLMMREGFVAEVKGRTVKVILPSLGFALVAVVKKSNLEPVRRLTASFV